MFALVRGERGGRGRRGRRRGSREKAIIKEATSMDLWLQFGEDLLCSEKVVGWAGEEGQARGGGCGRRRSAGSDANGEAAKRVWLAIGSSKRV